MTNNSIIPQMSAPCSVPVVECLPFRMGSKGSLHFLIRKKNEDGTYHPHRLGVVQVGFKAHQRMVGTKTPEFFDASKCTLEQFIADGDWVRLSGYDAFPWEGREGWLQYSGRPPFRGYYWHVLRPSQTHSSVWQIPVMKPVTVKLRSPRAFHPEPPGMYHGTYAQEVCGWTDDMINDVLDGCPDAIWNII